jgi:addiction module HigA family antidote
MNGLHLAFTTITKEKEEWLCIIHPTREKSSGSCVLSLLGLTVTEAAKGLGVSRKTLSALLNGRFGISPEMAIRLSKAFGVSAESWITQQAQYDLWQALQKADDVIKVKAFA